MKKTLFFVRGLLSRNWVMPLVVVSGGIICAVMVGMISLLTVEASVEQRRLLSNIVDCFLVPQLLLLALLPLWLVVRTVQLLVRKRKGIWMAWLWSFPAGIVAFVCLFNSVFYINLGCFDTFAADCKLPESMTPENSPDMAVPVGMLFFDSMDGKPMPPVVQRWKERCEVDYFISLNDSEELTEQTPNAEKLAAVAPDLLAEYKLRSFCRRALSPGYRAPAYLDLLVHSEDADLRENHWKRRSRDEGFWSKVLSNGWNISIACDKDESGEAVPDCFDLKRMKLLDESLAPLAANPTREGLEALVPPLPEKPTIVLLQDREPGIYRLILVAPPDYPEGAFSIKAQEQLTNSDLSMRHLPDTQFRLTPYRQICRMTVSEPFKVFNGEWGEYYASVWSLYFTPADGGEPQLVNRQLYLMQGWSR